jgi:hypothetical protein
MLTKKRQFAAKSSLFEPIQGKHPVYMRNEGTGIIPYWQASLIAMERE